MYPLLPHIIPKDPNDLIIKRPSVNLRCNCASHYFNSVYHKRLFYKPREYIHFFVSFFLFTGEVQITR